MLMGHAFGFDRLPRLVAVGQEADGELLIGDQALVRGQAQQTDDQYGVVTDLSQMWLTLNGLPFVFARWVVKKDASSAVKKVLAGWLETFKEKETALVEQAVIPSARALGLSEKIVKKYFDVIRRCLEAQDLQGQQLFTRKMETFGRKPLFK